MAQGYFYTTKGSYQQAFPIDNAAALLGDSYRFYQNIRKLHWTPPSGARGSISKGITWEYEVEPNAQANDNAYPEGSEAAPVEHFLKMKMGNNFQIAKGTYGLSGTAIAQGGIEGLEFQRANKFRAFCKDINKALIKNTQAVEGTEAVAGKLKGVYGFFTASNEFDANNHAITADMLEEIGFLASEKGVTYTAIYCHSKQKAMLNLLYGDTLRTTFGQKEFVGTDISTISNITGLNGKIKIYVDDTFDRTDLVFVAEPQIACVTLREEINKDISKASDDKKTYQLLKEFTLKVDHPFAVARIKALTPHQ